MTSVETELWNIFTYYTLRGDSLDPEHLKTQQFMQFLRDCMIVEPRWTTKHGRRVRDEPSPEAMELYCGNSMITAAQATVYFTKEVSRLGKGKRTKSLTFDSFLNALMRIAHVEIYPDKPTVDLAFQELLMCNVLPYPLASRRASTITTDIATLLVDSEMANLRHKYSPSLQKIFRYYASSKRHAENRAFIHQKAEPYSQISPRRGGSGKSSRRGRMMTKNSMTAALGYRGFVKFTADFALANSILSIFEIGDIFLTCTGAGAASLRKLTFGQFWEALVRCALVAYSTEKNPTVTTDIPDKLRGLFLYMWREINKAVPRAVMSSSALGVYSGSMTEGARLFNSRVSSDWAAAGFRDYLSSATAASYDGRATLQRLCAPSTRDELKRVDVLAGLIGERDPAGATGADAKVVMDELDYQLRQLSAKSYDAEAEYGGGGGGLGVGQERGVYDYAYTGYHPIK